MHRAGEPSAKVSRDGKSPAPSCILIRLPAPAPPEMPRSPVLPAAFLPMWPRTRPIRFYRGGLSATSLGFGGCTCRLVPDLCEAVTTTPPDEQVVWPAGRRNSSSASQHAQLILSFQADAHFNFLQKEPRHPQRRGTGCSRGTAARQSHRRPGLDVPGHAAAVPEQP